jgi:hypothetical protein
MDYLQFINRVIDEGINAAKKDYTKPEEKTRLEGSIAGFEACRNKMPHELIEVDDEARQYAHQAYFERDSEKYWWFRCYQLEVEWVMNCVSAMLLNEGEEPLRSFMPTVNAMTKAASIIGVRQS